MHTILNRLVEDHRHILKLLSCLDFQMDRLQLQKNGNNFSLILDILEYLMDYPERCHHPVEDSLYNVLLRKHSPASETIWKIQTEHVELANLGNHVKKSICDLSNGENISKESVHYNLRIYTQRQMDHMQREEELLFPLARANLTNDDWAQLSDQLDKLLGPLCGRDIHQKFEDLYNTIMQEEAEKLVSGDSTNSIISQGNNDKKFHSL